MPPGSEARETPVNKFAAISYSKPGRAILAALSLLASPVVAANASPQTAAAAARKVPEPPRGFAGTVVSTADEKVVLRQKDGTEVEIAMTRGWTVSTPRRASVNEVRLGEFVGSASLDAGPGRGRANELRVFEPGYRPEYGTHSVATPQTSMTHGFVFAIRPVSEGSEFEVAYPDGKRTILVPSSAPVTVFDLLPRSAAAPGVEVSLVTRPGPDGVRRASRLTIAPAH